MKAAILRKAVTAAVLLAQGALCLLGFEHYSSLYRMPLSMNVSAVAQVSDDGMSWSGMDMGEVNRLEEGARFQINFMPIIACYAYLVHVDGAGKTTLLYERSKASGPLDPGRVYTLPSPKEWYMISEVAREERLNLVVSGRPLPAEEVTSLAEPKAGTMKGVKLAVPLSDGSLYHTNWKVARGKGIMVLSWTLRPVH